MTTLLQINASLFSDAGQSTRLSDRFVAAWVDRHPDTRVVRRDLAREPVPHLDAERFTAFGTAAADRTPAQREAVAASDALIDELRAAEVVVLGLPMYNFGIPSQLKAYFDHVARAGVTFRYTANGPLGLIDDKPVYVLAARGGRYAGTARDTQTAYVREFLAFIGLTDVTFVHAEGLAGDAVARIETLEAAHATIDRLAQRARPRAA